MQGVKLTFFTGSHLAPKYFKLVANSKKLVVKIHTSYKEDTRMGHIQRERLPKSKMASRFTFSKSCMCWDLVTGLTRNFAADLSLQIFYNHWISR